MGGCKRHHGRIAASARRDMNADGYPDGILGETILLNQPDKIGYFLCAIYDVFRKC
jgi:hypothetical protein